MTYEEIPADFIEVDQGAILFWKKGEPNHLVAAYPLAGACAREIDSDALAQETPPPLEVNHSRLTIT